ncbi:MAG: hypothetical protein OXH04_10575 [Acidobacteria bacterium]|nr:hypothetical protein [Acidobacteriota bacterium]
MPASEAPGGSAAQDDGIVAQLIEYVGAQQALAADDADRARAALERLIAVADDVTRPLVQAVARADDIETMRQRFKPLSEFLAALDLPQGYARAYCPMYDGGSNWVQLDGPVRNPFYGSTMLTCGVVDAAPGAHMDHTPRHGGTVFMAPDGFHHIEGAYPEPGVFRIYATDNYREPVDVTLWMGRAVLEEEYDAATDEFREVTAFAMLPAPGGAYLEAEVGDVGVPAEIIARLQFEEDFPEERFDFIFAGFSGDAPRETLTLDRPNVPPALPLAERIRPRIPERTSDIVGGIEARDREIVDLVTRGAFTEIFIPALQAKELALALHDRAEALPTRARDDVRIAVRSLVRAAWLLDWYGDLGNKQQVDDAYGVFGSAVSQISRVYGEAAAP